MIFCITGVPGSGKSTICRELSRRGIPCINAMEIPGANACRDGDEVDLDCLKSVVHAGLREEVVEGHFTHFLGCQGVIIVERDEDRVMDVLRMRGYAEAKMDENIDVLRADTIYQEALEFLPSTRIHRLRNVEGTVESSVEDCMRILEYWKNKD